MTSTSFNVGLTTGTRNSSKVLKPPGGGSSDIFGTSGESVEPQRKTRTHLTSSIFGEESATPSRNKIDGNPVASDGPTVNGASSAPESGASTPAPTFSGPAPAPANNKPRVPPGGFSSGLW
uniref:Microtubule-associated protein Jupiter n=1 Tax=Graphocephala atropunctata TaxID=36148 RepID=A0A1B6KGY8_9HEMI